MNPHLETGKKGETLAKEYLISKGYTILHENWRKGSYEIDLIAQLKDLLVVVEVKTRSYSGVLEPQLAVNKSKQQTLCKAARIYLTVTGSQDEVRFDIISIISGKNDHQLEHIEDAFRPYSFR